MSAGTRSGAAISILGSIALAIWLIAPRTRDPLSWDAVHTYLPMAHSLLEQGWAFMQRPESLATGPVGFLYPALLGADAITIRWANVLLYSATIALGFEAARLAHSWQAGAIAALMLAVSPTLHPYVADVLTEPPFFFLITVWGVAVARSVTLSPAAPSPRPSPRGEGEQRGDGMVWVVVGGVALALATLTRPAVMYFAPVMVIVFLVLKERRLAAMHGIALAGSALWIARNALSFGFPAVSTGAGTALFLGINPLVDGYYPAYFGLMYDQGAAAPDISNLSIEADRTLRAIALVELRDTPLAIIAEMAARKTIAFLFVSSAEISHEPLALLRSWRIALVILACVAIAYRGRSRIVIALAALVAYMLLAHMPVVYSLRYSVGAIDIPLTLLAAIGLAEAAATPARIAAVSIAATIGIGAGLLLLEPGRGSPRIERAPFQLIWSGDVRQVDELHLENTVRTGPATFSLSPGAALELAVTNAPLFHPWDMSMATLEVAITPAPRTAGCQAMRLRYRKPDEARFAEEHVTRAALKADGQMRRITIGAVPLAMNHEGVLRIEFECAFPATLEMGTISIAAPRRATYYRERYLKETGQR